ncbi:MAG: hypothetical protein HRU09_05175 [Oligoflexales bacterium]|nr:hypothetical protein [Oligoflexales bacterium]
MGRIFIWSYLEWPLRITPSLQIPGHRHLHSGFLVIAPAQQGKAISYFKYFTFKA